MFFASITSLWLSAFSGVRYIALHDIVLQLLTSCSLPHVHHLAWCSAFSRVAQLSPPLFCGTGLLPCNCSFRRSYFIWKSQALTPHQSHRTFFSWILVYLSTCYVALKSFLIVFKPCLSRIPFGYLFHCGLSLLPSFDLCTTSPSTNWHIHPALFS